MLFRSYPLILSLCDYISLSAAAASDAARALRKEIKYAVPDAQERAVRLLGIMMRNSDLRFKRASVPRWRMEQRLTRWCECRAGRVEKVPHRARRARDEQEDGAPRRRDDLARALPARVRVPGAPCFLLLLSPIAPRSHWTPTCPKVHADTSLPLQRDAELSPITTLWNKLKPPSAPVNGAPLAADDPLFTPTADPRRTTRRASGRRAQGRFPTQAEHLADLRKEATAAKGNAAMLHESVAFSPAEELASNELVAVRLLPPQSHFGAADPSAVIVQEFYSKCFASQQAIASNLDWLTVQAEQARQGVRQNSLPPAQQTGPAGVQLSSNNPFASKADPPVPVEAEVETDEELTLAVLLSANSDVRPRLPTLCCRLHR